MPSNIKAIGLLSGGLNSVLALKLGKDQNVEVIEVHLLLPFADDKRDYATHLASQLSIPHVRWRLSLNQQRNFLLTPRNFPPATGSHEKGHHAAQKRQTFLSPGSPYYCGVG